jgi:acyl-CoA synthetase (AMP-forming)/AMP-acid ligase II
MDDLLTTRDRAPTAVLPALNSIDFVRQAFRCYDSARPFAVLKEGIDPADYPGLGATERLAVAPAHGWAQLVHRPRHSDDLAQIVFTSGTEGRPKAVCLSHRNLAVSVERLNAAMGLTAEVREYVGVPVTYSFGLGRVRAVSAAGGAFYLPERFDPAELRRMLEAGEVNAVSAVPSLWRIVLANPAALAGAGAQVRWIEIGSQYMPRAEKEAMVRLFPNARILQHYGLTEASRTTFLDLSAAQGEALESVGRPTGAVELRIGTEGEICIRGPHVARGILQDDGSMRPVTDAEGWLHTSDRGEIRAGDLFYLGRLDDQINVAGVKVAAEALERDIRDLVGAAGSFAIAAIPDPLRGDGVLLALAAAVGDRRPLLVAAAELALKRHGIQQPGVLRVMEVAALPVTETGKIQRRALRDRHVAEAAATAPAPGAAAGAGAAEAAAGLGPAEQRVARAWQAVVGPIPVSAASSFYDVGGDSLSAVQLGLVMEGQFNRAAVRATFEGRPLAEVARLAEAGADAAAPATAGLPEATVKTWAINATRGVMVLSVLLSHWGPGLFDRFGLMAVADRWFGLLYRMGTPGFGTVFGVGLGFFMLPDYLNRRASVAKRLRSSLLLVLAGLVVTGGADLVLQAVDGQPLDGRTVAGAFYNVLAYYTLALIGARLWLGFLARRGDPVSWALGLAIGSWMLWWGAEALLPTPLDSLLEWPRLMLVADHYSIFRVSAVVFAGLAMGYRLARQDAATGARDLMAAGGFGVALSLLAGLDILGPDALSGRSGPFYGGALGAVFFASAAFLMLGGAIAALRAWGRLPRPAGALLRGLIVIGGLALPIYAFHRVVIPVKDILVAAGLHGGVALLIPMGIFLALLAYGWRRLRRMYFA